LHPIGEDSDILVRPMRPFRSLTLAFALSLLAAAPVASQEPSGTLWYTIEIDGVPAGWSMEQIERGEGRTTTSSRMALRLRRGSTSVRIELASRFVETEDGDPVRLWQHQALGRLPVESTFRFRPDGVEVITDQAGRETHEIVPLPRGEWLPPDAARRATVEHLQADEARFTLRLIDPFQGLEPIEVERERLGPGTIPGSVGRWRERTLGPAVDTALGEGANEATLELDPSGRLVASSTTFLGMELTVRRTDRRSARAALDDGAGPELMVSTFVRPDRPIPEPRRVRRAVYDLILPAGSDDREPEQLPMPPSTHSQSARRLGKSRALEGANASGDRIRIVVDADGGAPTPPQDADGVPVRPERGPDRERHLAASPYLDHEDPAVRALLVRSHGPGSDPPTDRDGGPARPEKSPSDEPSESPFERALRLAALVHGSIADKTLDTGFATASEVARTGAGDCTEHAVLLAALLRAEGIPSRVVSGLVYLEELAGVRDVFGYHMWTQALIGDRWVDLDATLAPPAEESAVPAAWGYGFDATHIALATSPLAGPDAAADFLPVAPLIGRLEIRVVELDRIPPRPPQARWGTSR
jgi:transglutaminase-like putative cysteine protease